MRHFASDRLHPDTLAIATGRGDRRPGSPLNVPPVLVSTFVMGGDHVYARDDATPTIVAFEEVMGALEGGEAVAFSSGMAAMASVLDRLPPLGRVAIPTVCYQGTTALARRVVESRGGSLVEIDQGDTDGWIDALATADVVVVESPNNPMLRVADLSAIAAVSERRALLTVDNTVSTHINQKPLAVGADVVVHSATKAIGGHSDLLLGVVVVRDEWLAAELRRHRQLSGAIPGALESFLAIRGIRTLPLRMERSQENAGGLAERLAAHPAVSVVHYPGLPAHPDHTLAVKQLAGFGALLAFEVHGGSAIADAVCRRLELIVHATSLGGIETTIERRAAVLGQEYLPETLLRLAVGCEHLDDLWRDLAGALEAGDVTGRRSL